MPYNKDVEYWMELAKYDCKVAKSMFEKRHYLYCAFMSHQAIEKILKAYFVFAREDSPPFTHKLLLLLKAGGLLAVASDDQKEFLAMLDPLNIEARYPAHKANIHN